MAERLTITGTTPISLGIVDSNKQGIAVQVAADAALDSGTLTISSKLRNETNAAAEALDATLTAGDSATYTVGAGVELIATASGASAAIELIVAQY